MTSTLRGLAQKHAIVLIVASGKRGTSYMQAPLEGKLLSPRSLKPAFFRAVHLTLQPAAQCILQNCHFCRKVSHSSAIGRFYIFPLRRLVLSVRSFWLRGEINEGKKQMACPTTTSSARTDSRSAGYRISCAASRLIKGPQMYAPCPGSQRDYSAHYYRVGLVAVCNSLWLATSRGGWQ